MRFRSPKLTAYSTYMLYSALSAFATSTIFVINMVYQIEVVRLNPLQLVLVGTALETSCMVFQVPTGVLADIYSRRLAVVVGVFLTGAGFLLEGLIPTFAVVLLSQLIWGLGATFTSGAEEAWVADEIGEEKMGHAFLRGSQLSQLFSLLAIPFGIWLATFRLNLPVVVGAGVLLLLSVVLFICMPEHHFAPTPRGERSSWQEMGRVMVDGARSVRRSRLLLLILAITACYAMASEGFDRLQIDHFIQDYTFPVLWHLSSVIWFGIISAGTSLFTLGVTEILRRRVGTTNQYAMVFTLALFNALLIVSIVVFALASNFYLALAAFWCASVFRSADKPLYTAWVARNSDPKIRATVISMFGQVDAIGQILGGPGVGAIGLLVSLRAALLATGAILAPNVFLFARALQITRRRAEDVPEAEAQPVP